ncbi:MAG TPA: MFS transporter [Candidatus Limadaptatus stercoravium]|nr:MFS transporter [Candidatus Limadaptatus stercoravium]
MKAKTAKPAKDLSYRQSPDYVPTKEKVFYGMGALMDGGGVALMSCVMLKYMEGGLGIPMAIASTIMMVAKIWDAITDPLMGFISDNTRGRYGRRKPYMVVGGVLLIIGIFLLFLPVEQWGIISAENQAGLVAWMVIMYLLWNTFSTITMVPYCSMSSDISPSFKERNNANTVKLVFNAVASGLAYVLPLLFIEALIAPTDEGYLFMPKIDATEFWLAICLIFGTLFGGGLILCGIFVKERIKATTPKEKFNFKQFIKNYAEPYKNKSYRWHIAMYVAAFTCLDMISALAVYYATDVWAGRTLFGMDMSSLFIIAPLMVAAVIMFPLARYVMDKKSKQFAFRMGLPAYIIAGIMLAVMDPSWAPPVLVPIVSLLMGFGFGGAQMMPWIIFPDTVDVGQMATGERSTGTYSGMMTLARKIAGALGVGLVGWILGGVGYVEGRNPGEQTDEVLLAVRLIMGLAIVVFIAIAFYASFRYKITNKKLTRVRYFIEARKSGTVLSEEEEAERTALVHELYGAKDPGGYVTVLAGADGAEAVSGGEEANADTPEAAFGEAFGTDDDGTPDGE